MAECICQTPEPESRLDILRTSTRSRRGHAVVSARGLASALVALGVLVSGCQGTVPGTAAPTLDGAGAVAVPTLPIIRATPAVLVVSPADLSTDVLPDAPISVRASSGTLGTVTLLDAKGGAVAGHADPGGVWGVSELLRPSTAYTFTVAATGPDGTQTTTRSTFMTLKPKVTATYGLIPNGGNVGVGMPVIVQFGSAVATKAQRAAVERRVKVTTVPVQQGAWGWLDNRQLMWRPKEYWRPGTRVTVSTPLHGLQTGDSKWIAQDDATSFTVGSAMVSTVDIKAHTLTVRRDGAVIRTIPVSTGKPGPKTETRTGTKVIIQRQADLIMDSATVGVPKGRPDY